MTFDYDSDFLALLDVRGYTTMLIQFKVVYMQSSGEWVDLATSTSKITATLVAVPFSRAEAMLALLSAWTQL